MPYTNINLFSNYHDNLVDLVIDDDTKVITAYFDLKPADIIALKLSSTVYINGFYYIINKVQDYDVQGKRLTKVELIKLVDAIKPATPVGLISINNITPSIATPSNVVEITGTGFETAVIPSDTSFAYHQLQSNVVDLFGNFSAGEVINPGLTDFDQAGGRRGFVADSGTNRYVVTDDDPNSGLTNVGLLDQDGTKTHTVGFRVYFDTDKGHSATGNGEQPLFFAGTTGSYEQIYVDNNGLVKWERFDSGSSNQEIVSSSTALANDDWYAIVIRYKHDNPSERELWINDSLEGVMSDSTFNLDIPLSTDLDALYLGHNPEDNVTTSVVLRTWRITNKYVEGLDFEKLTTNAIVRIFARDTDTSIVREIEPKWHLSVSDTQLYFTVPQQDENDFFPPGSYKLYFEYRDFKSLEFDFTVVPVPVQTSPLDIRLDSQETYNTYFDYLERQWGGDNGGVVSDNVVFETVKGQQELVTYANGDNYTGSITGVDGLGASTGRKDRVGGVAISKTYWGFGEYTVEALPPNVLGVAPAFWTFHYEEIYRGDPRYNQFISESLHESGTEELGFYIVRNHEIDIEIPSHLPTEDVQADASVDNLKMNGWRGELKSAYGLNAWQNSDSDFYEEYRDWLVPVKETHKNQMTPAEQQFGGARWSNFGGSSVTITQNQDIPLVTSGSATRIESTGGSDRRKYVFTASKDSDYDHQFGMWVYNQGPSTVNIISDAAGYPNRDIPVGSIAYVRLNCTQNNSFCSLQMRTQNSGDDMDIICFQPSFIEGLGQGTPQISPTNRLDSTEIQFEGRWSGSTTPTTDNITVEGSTETGYRVNSGSKYELAFTSSKAPDDFLYEGLPYRFGAWIKNNSEDVLTVSMSGSVSSVESDTVSPSETKYVRVRGNCNDSNGEIAVTIENTTGSLDFTGYDPILAEYSIDGYREYGWTWDVDYIDFYIDGQLQDTVRNNISSSYIVDENDTGFFNSYVVPDIPGRFNMGLWFPSAGNGRNWAGDANGEAPFSRTKMNIRRVKFNPSGSLTDQRNIGETYGDIGVSSPAGNTIGSGPTEG